jgi:hypothetical protein
MTVRGSGDAATTSVRLPLFLCHSRAAQIFQQTLSLSHEFLENDCHKHAFVNVNCLKDRDRFRSVLWFMTLRGNDRNQVVPARGKLDASAHPPVR